MRELLPQNLVRLSEKCPLPLYLVGGSVRDFLAGKRELTDFDLSSPADEESFLSAAEECGFRIRAVYRATGTVKLEDEGGTGYEFTRFRSDEYVRGIHTPSRVEFTGNITRDALRRDFRANAVYYDIKNGRFIDPLNGIADIEKRRLTAVREAERVFGEDGLRLMRLCRIAAETGFSPDEETLAGAKANAALISDIVPERIFAELSRLLFSDEKGGKDAPYRGLCLLRASGVLPHILPELAAGEGMDQRADFHSYDVLEHSFRCVLYAPKEIRFAALLHDVGKPFAFHRDGNFHAHPEEGARLAEDILTRLKAPKGLTQETVFLVSRHMRDFDCRMKNTKVRREIVLSGKRLPLLLALKQADYSACKDDLSPAPCVVKWNTVLDEMKKEGVPFTVKELKIDGPRIQALGVPAHKTAEVLGELLLFCLPDGRRNNSSTLEKYARRFVPQEGAPCRPSLS